MVISHWYQLIEGLQASPLDFYKCIEEAIDRRKVPGLTRSHVLWPEGGLLSAKREYLRLTREKLLFDICAAPFGTGFFVSCRLVNKEFPWHLVFFLLAALPLVFISGIVILLFVVGERANGLVFAAFLLPPYVVTMVMVVIAFLLLRNALLDVDRLLLNNTFVGPFYERITRRNTYYRIDLMLMFNSAVHAAVMEVVDKHTDAQHLKPLSELERKPVLSKLFMR